VIGLKARYEIELSVSSLIQRGVSVVGRYVLTERPDDQERPYQDPSARRRLAGLAEAIDGGELIVGAESGVTRVPASDAWVEARTDNFMDILEALTGEFYPEIAGKLNQEMFELVGAEGRMRRTAEVATSLVKHSPVMIARGLNAYVGRPVGEVGARRVENVPLGQPVFVFDFSGEKTKRFPDQGLKEFGPFDSEAFTPKAPHIAVVTPKQFRGSVEGFMTSFRDGIKGSAVYSQGFIRKFRLTDCRLTFTAFEGSVRGAPAYRQACLDAVTEAGNIDLAIVVTSKEQEHLTGDASPYLVSKSAFMSHGVPVQEFQIEKIRRPDIANPLNTMTLACYAKLGGIPYVMTVPRRVMAQELVIGIGSANVSQNRMTSAQRFVGITTVFSSDGNYLVSNISQEALYEEYPEALLRALRTCLEDVKSRNAWQSQDCMRLIFHVFKPLKDRETRAVKSLVEDLTKEYSGVEFAFLQVGNEHDWIILDRASNGVDSGQSVKGKYVPARGRAVRISRSEMVVSVCGPYDMKLHSHGAPRPLMLKLHREATFTDLDYLAGQAYRFTALSWRRPFPSRKPVTILYSDLIAELLGKLREVTNWNSDMLTTSKLRWSRWFL